MKTSELGEEFIISFEKVRLTAYDDGCGVWTIGIGRTQGVRRGDVCSAKQAFDWFAAELSQYGDVVDACVTQTLNQAQFDALTSFTYNAGATALRSSTLLRLLNAGDYKGAAAQFVRWNKGTVNGKLVELAGLTLRRQAERRIFETGVYDMHDGGMKFTGAIAFTDVISGVV